MQKEKIWQRCRLSTTEKFLVIGVRSERFNGIKRFEYPQRRRVQTTSGADFFSPRFLRKHLETLDGTTREQLFGLIEKICLSRLSESQLKWFSGRHARESREKTSRNGARKSMLGEGWPPSDVKGNVVWKCSRLRLIPAIRPFKYQINLSHTRLSVQKMH